MTLTTALVVVSALLAIVGGVTAVSARRLMRSVASLALLFVGVAGLFGALGAPYLAAAQLFLFVGGVVTLLALAFGSTATPLVRGRAYLATGALLFGLLIGAWFLPPLQDAGMVISAHAVAAALFVNYGPALEIALLIILSGVISIGYVLDEDTRRERGGER